MRTSLPAPAFLLTLALSLAACSGDSDGPATANDPAAPGSTTPSNEPTTDEPTSNEPALPTEVPGAPGVVRSRNLATVMDAGDGAELCLGAIAESYPPQCGGPAISNWSWKDYAGTFEKQGDIRWATYAVTGTWDGTEFTVNEAISGALYDPMPIEPTELPTPATQYTEAELDEIATTVGSDLPSAGGAYIDQDGHVLVGVTYDDGTLQDYVDATYGAGVVVVSGQLVDAG